MDPETYGSRLYANFKPTKPPGEPLTLMHLFKKSMNSTSAGGNSASLNTTHHSQFNLSPAKAYNHQPIASNKMISSTDNLVNHNTIKASEIKSQSVSPMRTEYAARTWHVDQDVIAKASKSPFRLVKKISSGSGAYQ